jgi:HopA1 effector protein family
MQVLESPQSQLPNPAADRVLNALNDIANNLQIQSNFSICHPEYRPLELPTEAISRFQQLPLDLQNRYVSLQLQSFLYGIYYNGSMRTSLALGENLNDLSLHQNLENNSFLGVDLDFYERLHEKNSGEGYFDPDWTIVRHESDDSLVVAKGGLTLHVNRERHLKTVDQSTAVGEFVAIRMPRNLVQNGFYMAVSNSGLSPQTHIVRVYFNLSPDGAIAVMGSLTKLMNETEIPFTFKVLYNPSDYIRYDSGVLYFERSQFESVRQVLHRVYTEQRSHFQTEVPLFTKILAPGLALAEEPDSKFSAVESFGINRCQIIVNGLLEARQSGDESAQNRMEYIHRHFSLLGIDWQHLYLNANSEDIYTPLENC